ncbi:sodium:alanine symporter family protein [Balneolaceae bacterium ANBcel3]|nr:sodium:alanine symporter family protein [Balneolaceae bacterium ANBcel3]
MEVFETIINTLDRLVWSTPEIMPIMVIVLLSYGLFITLRLGFIQVRKFTHGLQVLSGKFYSSKDKGDVNHFQALSTALSATVGIGNIAGVALAIHFGGPGALFWMWITAIFGMAIKYSECTLGALYRKTNKDGSVSGGPMYYIEYGLGKKWKWLAVSFAVFAVICSFLTGNGVQANTVADTMQSTFGIPKAATGFITATLVALVIIGGIKRIGIVTARLVPVMAILYLAGAFVILLLNHTQLIDSFVLIFTSAFNPQAGAFGIGSGAFMVTFVWGIRRGLFSNEAGQGSAPIAHAASKTSQPVRVGVVALMEPFIDTIVICTMTGLVIIATGSWDSHHQTHLNLNHQEISVITESSEDIPYVVIRDGQPEKHPVLFNHASTGAFYTDPDFTAPFNGRIVFDSDGRYAIDDQQQTYSHLYTSVIHNGAPLTAAAFERGLAPLFPGGRYLVTICVLLFAVSTSISWSYYGDRSIQYLFGDRSIFYYRVVYVLMHFAGALLTLQLVWTFGDVMLGLMSLPNLIALFALSGVVYKATKTYFEQPEV